MSTTIDERVVEMRFDNKNFESNVATSMSTLEKLKQKLNLSGAAKGLEDINAAAGKINMSGLSGAIETVTAKFSALDVVAITALTNITNKAINAGEQLVKSLSVDQISSGWDKYAQKTTSVQTLVNSTGKSLDEINGYLEHLMWYSDETSYGFTDMTAALATMTSSGGDIEKLIPMIEGVANATAYAGKGAAEFSRVMQYGVNQAYSLGYMQAQDWRTIEGATVNSKQLIQALIAAGEEIGTIEKGAVTLENFRNSLADKWLTTEVMETGFGQFSKVTEEIYEGIESGIFKNYADGLEQIGDKYGEVALRAAASSQEAKTFTEAIDATKDAVSSQWMTTFELIFGNYEKAKVLWTDLAGTLWDVFASGGETRNKILESALGKTFTSLLEPISKIKETVSSVGETISTVTEPIKTVTKSLEDYNNVVNEVIRGDWGTYTKRWEALTEAGYDWVTVQNMVNEKLGNSYRRQTDYVIGQETMAEATEGTVETNAKYIAQLAKMSDAELEAIGLTKDQIAAIKEIRVQADKLGLSVEDFVENIDEIDGRWVLINSFKNAWAGLVKVFEAVKAAWEEVFPPKSTEEKAERLYDIIAAIHKFSTKLIMSEETAAKVTRTFKGLFSVFNLIKSIVGGAINAAFEIFSDAVGGANLSILDVTASVGDALVVFSNWVTENQFITKGFNKLVRAAKSVIKIVKSWIEAFEDIPVVSEFLENIKSLFADINEDATNGTNNIEKWVGSFDGLTAVGKVLDKVGEAFEWIGEIVEKAITAVGAWFEVFRETEGVQHLIEGVTDLVDAFSKLFAGELDANEFATALGNALGEITASIPEIALQIGKDFIAGFTNGLGEGIGEVITNILEFCNNFISAFMEGLGEHSPSVIAEEAGVNWVQGFINGIESMLEPLMTAVQPIIDFITGVFKSFWGYITDENGEIQWDKIFAGVITIEALAIALKFAEAFQTLANAMTSFSGIFSAVKNVLNNLSKTITEVGKAVKWDLMANAVLKMAIAVGILAVAIFMLAKIDDVGKLWNAVGVIIVLAGVVAALAWVMSQLGDASISFSAAEKKLDISGMKTTILQLGIALLLLAATVKIIGSMRAEEAQQGLVALIAMMTGMMIFMAAMGKINTFAKDLTSFGPMMTRMAVAMLLMVVVVKMVGKLSEDEIGKGIAFMAAFAIFTTAIGLVSALCGEHVSKFGTMMIKLAIAMGLLVIVCKLVNKLSAEEMLKGAAFAAAFVIFVKALVKATTIGGEQKLAAVGGVILAAGAAILLMAATCKILSGLTWGEIAKGLVCVVAFGLILAGLIELLKIGNKQKMGQVAGSLIGASIAILIMAGTAVILSMIPIEDLSKGVAIVALFGLIVAAMVKSLKGAENAQKAITAMAVCIALMAAAVIALSFLDPADLARCTAAMVLLMSSFALIVKSMNGLKKGEIATGTLVVLAGVLILMAGLITTMTHLMKDSTTAIAAAGALSLVMVAFATACKLMNNVKIDKTVSDNLKTMVICLGILAAVLTIMSLIPHNSSMIENAVSLGILINCLATAMLILNKVRINKTVSDNLVTMAGCMVILGMTLGIMSAFPHASSMIENAISLGILINCLASAMLILNNVKLSATVTNNLLLMSGCMALLGAVLLLMSAFPHASSMIENAISLGILINCLATAMLILNNVKLSATVTNNLLLMSGCMALLGAVLLIMSAFPHASSMIENAISLGILINCLASAMLIASLAGPNAALGASAMLTMAGVLAIVGVVVGLLAAFDIAPSMETALALSTLLLAMSAACLIASLIPAGAGIAGAIQLAAFIGIMAGVVAAAGALSQIPGFNELLADGGNTLGLIGEAIGKFVGGIIAGVAGGIISIIPQLGVALSIFAVGIRPFVSLISGLDASIIVGAGYLTGAILALSAASFISGVMDILTFGGSSLTRLGQELFVFGMYSRSFFDTIKNVDASAIEAANNVAGMILALTASELISTIVEKFGGSVDFSSMGENLKAFGEAVVGFSDTISGKVDVEAVEAATNAGALLVELNKSLPRSGGWIQKIIGEKDFETFSTACKAFAECIIEINNAVSQEGFELQSEKIEQLVAAGTQFSELNSALPKSGGVAQDLAGEQDLAAFGVACAAFANCMIAISQAVSSDEFVVQSDKISQLVTAGTQFNELNTALPKTGGIAQDFAGEQDLGRFGASVAAFAGCMVLVNNAISQEGFAVNLDAIEQLKQAGLKMNELQEALPKSGGWWESISGSQDIGNFGESIATFAEAIVDFANSGTGLNTEGVTLALSTAEKLKEFMTSLIDIDYSGVEAFTGIGSGLPGADGPAYDIAKAISKFSEEVADIDTETVTVAVSAARQLKTLIAGLVNLDTSGIENFKPQEIGSAMSDYSDKVADIDTAVVSSSITSANRLKSFISGLANLDTSGISNFKPDTIGTALNSYGESVSDFNSGLVSSSITSANRLRIFISNLAGLDTSGVSSFTAAIDELSTAKIDEFVEAFAGASAQMSTAGADMITGLIKGMESKMPALKATVYDMANTAEEAITIRASVFVKAGQTLATKLATGFTGKKQLVVNAGTTCATAAKDAIRNKYTAFYNAGSYLVTGFSNGISENTYKSTAKAKAMAEAAVKAAREVLKINSPSKVFREIGSGVPEGFAQGIGMLGGAVKDSVTTMASTAINTTRSAMATVLEALNSDMDTQPTIRPVVDLSDVQSGAAAIHGMFDGIHTVGVRSNLGAINATMNARLQNGTNDDIISAINKLNAGLENNRGDTYSIAGITYDDGSAISDAVKTIARYAIRERRV